MKYQVLETGSVLVDCDNDVEKSHLMAFLTSSAPSLKAGEVMKMLGISRETLCHYKSRGWIRAKKFGGQYRYSLESVMNLLNINSNN